jgi:hypothetical protein
MMPILSYGKESSRLVQPVADQNAWHFNPGKKQKGRAAVSNFEGANQFANKLEIGQGKLLRDSVWEIIFC